MSNPRVYEGVPYYRYLVRFTMSDGRRVRWVRWSPGDPWIHDQLAREFSDRFESGEVKPGSGRVTRG